ncbi:unnamed protein product [Darwinula stevensoni]|uniref:Acyl-coenzyme A oxidase n=1 Tax=Darwinula stevensoni TaxID=69355 RepID=A0A7R9A9G4_9CRUS|nr:unnamed protein product [Darwinula stevensoni]CAG0897403.1 unnamed protein product [Darwinula stevensoni]
MGKSFVNPDLLKERASCSFNKEELTNLLDGGKEATEHRRALESYILSIPGAFEGVSKYDHLGHKEFYEVAVAKSKKIMGALQVSNMEGVGTPQEAFQMLFGGWMGSTLGLDGNPLAVHYGMFLPCILGQGTPEQIVKWLHMGWTLEIIGCYAQVTELGHGTFVRGLETTAVYDPKAEEFILNTPTLTSLKWWPGGCEFQVAVVGNTATHAIVVAQLYTRGECRGVHPFIVPLRNMDDHSPLSGIEIGDIGRRMAFNAADNGFLRLTNVRIPRENLLMKHAQVLQDGTYIRPANSKLSYGTMVFVRVMICRDMCNQLKKAVTIATRYSAVRRQSEISPGYGKYNIASVNDITQPEIDVPGAGEVQILDFVTQQWKLFPALATAFGIHFGFQYVMEQYHQVNEHVNNGDLDTLPQLHILSCGLKAQSTGDAQYFVEVCRMACGGHGFLMSSQFPQIYGLCAAASIYEGENTVLWLQVARYLMKSELQQTFQAEAINKGCLFQGQTLCLDAVLNAFLCVAHGRIRSSFHNLQSLISQGGICFEEAMNRSSVALVSAAKAYIRHFSVAQFVAHVKNQMSQGTRNILGTLCRLYSLFWMLEDLGDFIIYAHVSSEDLKHLEMTRGELLREIRPEAVNLVDAFDLRDEVLVSALGAYDGNVYEHLYDAALKSPLNHLIKSKL